MEFENDPLRVNPWNVGSLEDFLVYSCPECLTFERSKYAFVEHATNEHPSCHELMFSLGFFEPESSVKKEAMDKIDPVEFVTDVIGEPVQPVQLQSEIVSISKIKTEQQESNPLSPLPPLMDIGINKNEEASTSIKRVLNVSEHETSAELRTPSFIFFEKLVPAKAKIQANIWEDRTEIPLGPKENVMYVMKNFNKDRTGSYKNPSCDYGPWKVTTYNSQYQIKDMNGRMDLQWICESENRDFGLKEDEKVVLKNTRCVLLADRKYVKTVTYVKQCPEKYMSSKDYCAVQYVGTDINGPNIKPHGSSKNGKPYKRSNPYMLEEAKEIIKNRKLSVKEVLSELSESYKGKTLPSEKAISNLIEIQKRKEKKNETEIISDQMKYEVDFSSSEIKIEEDDL